MYEQKISKRFGKTLVVPQATFEAAKATLKTIEAGQRKGGVAVLFTLLKPQLPLYGLALLLMAFDSAVGPATWHGIAALYDGIADGTTPLDGFGDTVAATFATLALCIFAHLTSWAITARCTARFSNAVRSQVLRGVLRQDTVFFDVRLRRLEAGTPLGIAADRPGSRPAQRARAAAHVSALLCLLTGLPDGRHPGAAQPRRGRPLVEGLPPPTIPPADPPTLLPPTHTPSAFIHAIHAIHPSPCCELSMPTHPRRALTASQLPPPPRRSSTCRSILLPPPTHTPFPSIPIHLHLSPSIPIHPHPSKRPKPTHPRRALTASQLPPPPRRSSTCLSYSLNP